MNLKLYFFLLILSSPFLLLAQGNVDKEEPKQINLLHADIGRFDNVSGQSAQKLIGKVKAEHEGSLFFCDSAYLYDNNSLDAFGDVHIIVNDTLDLYGDQLFYEGNTKIAEFHNNVRLVDKKATLYTDELIYDRKSGIGKYFIWGRIEDSTNVLTSKKGYYYNHIETVYFKDSVVVVNPDFVMKSDTLKYQTNTERVYFMGPSTIEGDSSFMYAESGFHDTQTQEARLSENAFVQNKTNTLSGDSIFYSKERGLSKVFRNVIMTDTANDVLVTGEFAIYNKAKFFAYVVDSAQAIFVDNADSSFLHADTLMIRFDSIEKPEYLFAYNHMKFFSKDMQGMADSLVYFFNDSTLQLHSNPFLWFEDNQISCQRIDLMSKLGELDSASFQTDVFLVSQDTVEPRFYNQVSGIDMHAWFREGDMRKILMLGKSETLYFMWEDDGTPVGMNRIDSKDMLIFLKDQELETITYIDKPTATLTPTQLVQPSEEKLRGFIWKEDDRPRKRADIFRKEGELEEQVEEE